MNVMPTELRVRSTMRINSELPLTEGWPTRVDISRGGRIPLPIILQDKRPLLGDRGVSTDRMAPRLYPVRLLFE